jgi:nucleotide-binding universal stress UspA family protein
MKVLLALDGSKHSLKSVDFLIEHAGWCREKPEIELVTVHLPVPRPPRMHLVVSEAQIQRHYQEEGEARLAAAKKKLDAAGIAYQARVFVGEVAETIVKHATQSGCDLIVIGSRGMTALGKALIGSTANKVLHFSGLPVLLLK